nr:Gag-Pol polyprotein [Tanacetum cinerariifolium]
MKGRLNLLHMDLCGPMRVASINEKKYILVIVDDYSRYTWTLFLRSKDETPEVLKEILTMSQRNLQALVINKVGVDSLGSGRSSYERRGTSSVNKSSSPTNKSNLQDTQPTTNIQPTSEPSTPTYVHAKENNVNQAEEEHLLEDEFTNPFCTLTKDHPLEQVRGNPSKPVQTRRQLATNPKMCMFALTVSTAKPKNIKEVMVDSALIEVMQEELY